MTLKPNYVLGLHPSSRGFGWALFEGPRTLVDWAVVELTGDKNGKSLQRIEKLLAQYQPTVLAMEGLEKTRKGRAPRVRWLHRAIVVAGLGRGLRVRIFSQAQIRAAFAGADARTRMEIAAAVANRIEPLRSRWHGPRKVWDSEPHSLSLFCAAACALTHYASEQSSA